MLNKVFKQPLSQEVWYQTYKWETDTDVISTFKREAQALASNEKDPSKWEEAYFDILSSFKYVPGGRITSNVGTGLKGTSLVNCFVSGFRGDNQDSIDGIFDELKRQAKILKSEGGYGFCANVLRPNGAYISGIGSESPGAVTMLSIWDTISKVITSGSSKRKNKDKGKNKIRKGAMMVTLSCWHPDVEDFVTAKQIPGNLTKFNMSVLIHDKFMQAVKNGQPWNLEFPDTEFEKYDAEWDGDLFKWKEKNYPVKVYKTYTNANELWNLITESTYRRNEPGILFIDRANHLNNLWYSLSYDATNPCGEQFLEKGGSCVLGAKNLTQYVNKDRTDFDYSALKRDIPVFVRMQDSVNDLTYFPLEEQREVAQKNRRVGIGYMGYGSALNMLKISYGSKEALEKTEKLVSFVTNEIYKASAMLAKEKGSFPNFDKEKFLQSNFVKQALTKETVDLIEKNGLRNAFLTTCAPTGNTGIFANCVTGGVEPVISDKYTRTIIVQEYPEGLSTPKNINWEAGKCEDLGGWSWDKEGDEAILKTTFNNCVYKVDRSRGLTREEEVYDYSVLEMGEEYWEDKKKMGKDFYGKTIFDLNVDDHITTLGIFAKYIDSSISKTINVPNDFTYEAFKDVYMKAYDTGYIKGVTTYRWGTMTSVVSVKEDKEDKKKVDARPEKVSINHSPKRPTVLPCDIHYTQIKGDKWVVLIGKLEGYPFEVFAGKLGDLGKFPEKGTITKIKSKTYVLDCEGREPFNIIDTFGEHGSYVYSKMLSHGVPLWSIIDMCDKMLENVLGFNKAMGRTLKKYVKSEEVKYFKCGGCGSSDMVFQEGCVLCRSCGVSKCS